MRGLRGFCFCLVLTVLGLSACGANTKQQSTVPLATTEAAAATTDAPDDSFYESIEYSDNGLLLKLPTAWKEQLAVSTNLQINSVPGRIDMEYMPDAGLALLEGIVGNEDISNEELRDLYYEIGNLNIPLATILVVKTNAAYADGNASDVRRLFLLEEPIGELGEYTYTFHYSESYDTSSLSDEELPRFNALVNELPAVKAGAVMQERTEISAGAVSFESQTLDGETLDSTFFNNYRITMVFLWATWDNTSIQALPSLAQLQLKLPDGVGLLGIVTDIYEGSDLLAQTRDLVQAAEISFPMIMTNNSVFPISESAAAFPTLLFFDQSGQTVGDAIVPTGTDATQLLAIINERLSLLSAKG